MDNAPDSGNLPWKNTISGPVVESFSAIHWTKLTRYPQILHFGRYPAHSLQIFGINGAWTD